MKSLCFKYDRHGIELLKRGLYYPIVNIDGLVSGYTGSGTKTVLPRKATAKIDIRFGPKIEPDDIVVALKKHLETHGYGDIEVIVRDCYTWAKTDFSERIVQNMLESYRRHKVEPGNLADVNRSRPLFRVSKGSWPSRRLWGVLDTAEGLMWQTNICRYGD